MARLSGKEVQIVDVTSELKVSFDATWAFVRGKEFLGYADYEDMQWHGRYLDNKLYKQALFEYSLLETALERLNYVYTLSQCQRNDSDR